MKYIHLILIFLTLTCASCDKMPENGELDGQWQLMSMGTRNNADASPTYTDTKGQRIYWRFQLRLLMIHTAGAMLNGHTYDTACRFEKSGNTLAITQTYIHTLNRDSLITDPASTSLAPVGIRGNTETFSIEKLDGKQMILQSDHHRLVFRKF